MTLTTAGIAGRQESWFGSYGEANEWILSPGMNAIQLLRAIPNWDNLTNAVNRSWDGAVYSSSQSYADQAIVYSRHPKTGKLFAVFRSAPPSCHSEPQRQSSVCGAWMTYSSNGRTVPDISP